ncbi:MAG TPA: hypothetical protein VND97_01955 [Beijerinckiaceae bacterium]|nr:hypothetical protein [Beijerinckiaceae bacterium]
MMKVFALLCLTSALLVGAIALGIGFPPAPVQAKEAASSACPLVATPLDEGYGVTRTIMRPDCAAAR